MGKAIVRRNGVLEMSWKVGDPISDTGAMIGFADAPAGGISLSRVPLSPNAQEVYGDELESHLAALADEIAAREPAEIARGGAGRRVRPICMACGLVLPIGSWLTNAGWVVRPMPGFPGIEEVYCGVCFARWGWPDE